MKLLIDIPEHIYEHAKAMTEDSRDEGEAMRAIVNGSPLSKGHGDFIAEKERLIKKDIASIENKVRHVFNQGYEMGVKAYKENMSSRSEIPNKSEIPTSCGDAISRKAAIDLANELKDDLPDDDRLSDMVMSHNEGILDYQTKLSLLPSVTPQPCGDAISRQAVLDAMYELCSTGETLKENPWRDNPHIDAITDAIENLPSVTPQQKVGRWIQKEEEDEAEPFIIWECSECHCVDEDGKPSYKYCPQCGARMEVE